DVPDGDSHTHAGQEDAQEPAHTSTEAADTMHSDATHQGPDAADTTHAEDDIPVLLVDMLDEELADSFMNEQTDPLIMDLEDALPPPAQGLEGAQPLMAQDDSLFPVAMQNTGTLSDTADVLAHDSMAASPGQPSQGQTEAAGPQTQIEGIQPAAAGAMPPAADMTESEADQMAVLQHLAQNGQ
ncbi:hypothetical protein V6C16_12835, partial [Desulfovibrio sp. 1188_IL3213]|uniref:hypothetical protein n=1 Tax=Desulfovibrio sp. 1188_IL3213 TaxID=3084052 RepID=UPI002FDB3448